MRFLLTPVISATDEILNVFSMDLPSCEFGGGDRNHTPLITIGGLDNYGADHGIQVMGAEGICLMGSNQGGWLYCAGMGARLRHDRHNQRFPV